MVLDINTKPFQNALINTKSWDATIQRLVTLACQTAFACRAGDFLQSPNWDAIIPRNERTSSSK